MTLGDRIRNARIAAGLSQKELAEALGVKRQAVNVWENSDTKPSVQLTELARVCGVRLEALTGPAAETDTPTDAESLKRTIGRSLGAIGMLMDEHLENVINLEVERRLQERLAEAPAVRPATRRFRVITPEHPDYGWLSAKLESIGVPKVAAGVPAPIIAEQDVTTQEWWSDPRNLKTMQRDREEARAEATGWLVDRIAIADQRVEEAVAKTPRAGAATPDGEHPPQHPAAGRRTRRPGR